MSKKGFSCLTVYDIMYLYMRENWLGRVLFLALVLGVILASQLMADTLILKDGRVVEGIIKAETQDSVKLEFEIGTIEYKKEQIESIRRSAPDESRRLQQKWEKGKSEAAGIRQGEGSSKEQRVGPKPGSQKVEHIAVDAVLNKKIPVKLLLDTGASYVVLSSKIGKKLGIDSESPGEVVRLQIGDGSRIAARYVSLKSVAVEGVEATEVGGAVLLDESENVLSFDGVLGMSFLNRFNFKVDHTNKRLTFEERR
jgi:clan AA aspartic protease (TIGR02281 family)